MGSLSLNNALSGVLSSQSALDVISHNVSNASDEDYTRQQAILKSNAPLLQDGEFYGTGVRVAEVVRQHSQVLESRLVSEKENLARFSKLNDIFSQIEAFLNEPSEESIRGTFSELDQSLQSLANNPENRGARSTLVGRASTFANVLKQFNQSLQELGGASGSINGQIQTTVNEINNIAGQISELNSDIATARGRGGNPNDLLDSRDALVKELSGLGAIETSRDNGKFRVTLSGYTIVQGTNTNDILFDSKGGEQTKKLLFDNETRPVVSPEGSRLKALFEMRDETIPELTSQVNDLAIQYVDRFNDVHRNGFGLDGNTRNNFFDQLETKGSGIFRLEGMSGTGGNIESQRGGYIDSPTVALAGDPSTAQPENFEADAAVAGRNAAGDPIGNPTGDLTINGSVISYDMREDSINDIINRINEADNQASAYLSAENRLVIKGTMENDYTISELEDSGLLLDKTNILEVGGSHRTANTPINNPGNALTAAGGDLSGFDGLDTIDVGRSGQTIQGNPGEAVNTDVQVENAAKFSAGEEVFLVENSNQQVQEVTINSVDASNNTINVDTSGITGDLNEGDAVAKNVTDLSEGTLDVESSETQGFQINYDTAEDTMNDIINRINVRARQRGSNVRAGINDQGRFQMFSFSNSQALTASETAGQNVEVNVSNAESFSEGQRVGIFEDNTTVTDNTGEITTVKSVDEASNTVTLDLANDYDLSNDAKITEDFNSNFNVSDEASQQITAGVASGSNVTVNVKDASTFGLGDEITISENDGETSETATVAAIDTGANTITLDNLSNSYNAGSADNDNDAAIQASGDTNRNRNLLSALGMDRSLSQGESGTEFAIEGQHRRPPVDQAVQTFEVSEAIRKNPDLIAAAQGDDTDLDGIAESTVGAGDGSNAQALSSLKSTKILRSGTVTPDQKVNQLISDIGARSSLVQREQEAAQTLVNDLQEQHQQISGVNIDQELTRMLQHQQVYQASSRIIQTTDELMQSLLQVV
jgi:flagellar hook-associated protein 1 FlgK